jgi:hypothetical protein
MFNIACNISNNDRIVRIVIGALLVLAAIFGFGRGFMILLGLILVVEGVIGWCGIPIVVDKVKQMMPKKAPGNPENKL